MVNNKFDLASQLIDNLKKGFLQDEQGNPLKFYHGTMHDFKNFGYSHFNSTYYGSVNPNLANEYAVRFAEDNMEKFLDLNEGANVRPQYVKSAKPWDFRRAEHREEVKPFIKKAMEENGERQFGKGTWRRPGFETVEDDLSMYMKQLEIGEWRIIEDKAILGGIKNAGYDGIFTAEKGSLNFGTFYPENIVPAFEVEAKMKDLEAMRAVNASENITKPARQVIDTTTSKIPFKKIDKSKTILKAINVTPGKSKLGVAAKAISVALRRKL